MAGWITLSRKLTEHWLYEEAHFDHTHAWIDLLMLANYTDKKKPYKGGIITCKRGDVNYSIKYLAERWGWNWRTVKAFLDVLEEDGIIKAEYTTNRTVITIVNYEKYQFQNDEMQNEVHNGLHNEIHNEVQNEVHNEVHITKKGKEGEKGNKEKKEKKSVYGEYQHVRLTDRERDRLFNDYGEAETLAAIKHLDEYMQMTGRTYKDHNLALRKWVFDAVREKKTKQPKQDDIMDWLKA